MRILFVNKFLDRESIYRIPLGILYLSAMIKNKHEVKICEPSRDNLRKIMKDFKPEVVAYSIRTGFHQYFIKLNRSLKKDFNFFSVFGGPHATFYPEIIKDENIDCVLRGEGEYAFRELLKDLNNKKAKNCWIKINNKIYKNPCIPLEKDLDKIPFPNRELLFNYKEIKNSKIQNFITSRGCPYDCTYCFNHKLKQLYDNKNYTRRRSVDNVLEEIEKTKLIFDFEFVHFEDDTFNLDKEWLREFVKKYLKYPFKCNVRANLFDEETAQLLKEANCKSVTFGLESGNNRVRNELYKRNMTKKQIINCARLLKKYGIKVKTENMLGCPDSTLNDDLETLDLNIICKPDYPSVTLLTPYPKTEIYEFAKKNNYIKITNYNKIGSYFHDSMLKLEDLQERKNLQRLFSLIVAFPFFRKYTKFLIKRKILNKFYYPFYEFYRIYSLMFKIAPHKLTLKDFLSNVRRYFTI